MSERDPLTRLLGTRGKDAGCEGALAVLAEFVEGELQGRNVRELLPAVAEHLRNCPACAVVRAPRSIPRTSLLSAAVLNEWVDFPIAKSHRSRELAHPRHISRSARA